MGLNITLLALGLGSGAIIALTALGLVVMYRSSGVINFATGGIGMMCSYVMWDLTRQAGWPALAGGIVSVAVGAVLGVVSYVLVMVLPRSVSNLTRVVGTLAVFAILQATAQLRYGPTALAVDKYLPNGAVRLGGDVEIPTNRILLLVVALVLSAALGVFYTRTTFGLATTALSEHPRKLAAFGWSNARVGLVNWALGGALAGLAGVLLAPIIGVNLGNGSALTVTVLAAALLGGLRSFPLTLIGGMVIGMIQSLTSIHDLGVPHLADAVPFLAIVAVLGVRGRGLPLRSFVGERLPRVGSGRLSLLALVVATAATVVLIGPILNDNGSAALTTTLLAAIPLLSLTVVLGYAGQMSLAQTTLAGVGALVAARLAGSAGLPFPLVVVLATLATVPVGLIVGLPSARTRGVSLAIATLGLAVAIQALLFGNEKVAGGLSGIPLSDDGSFRVFGVDFGSLTHTDRFAYLVLGVVVVVAVVVANVRRGDSGRRMIAVRSNERASAALGINVVSTKLWAFAVASAIAGLGGSLAAFRGTVATFRQYAVAQNITAVANSVVGGAGSVAGALFGSTLEPSGLGNLVLTSVFGIGPVAMALVAGLLLVATIVGAPDGMAASASASVTSLVARIRRGPEDTAPAAANQELPVVDAGRATPLRLEVRGVEVVYGPIQVLCGVDLDVEPGEVVGVIGANGAGKTTLIDAITGFAPARGSVRLGADELVGTAPHTRARLGVARSWQTLELIEELSVRDNLRVGSHRSRWWDGPADLVHPGRRTGARVGSERAVAALHLAPHLDRLPHELSTGQRKLVALARAIASEPSILLLDEPCSGLDQHEREEVRDVIRSLADDWGVGVLLVEHDIHLVRSVADRLVALDFGEVIASGSPTDVLDDARVRAAFLGDTAVRETGR